MTSNKGYILLSAGLLCIIAALAVFCYNIAESERAKAASESIVAELSGEIAYAAEHEAAEAFPSDNADRTMPKLTVDGSAYAGILTVPSLGLELPVCARLDMDAMQSAPCLYSGSLYRKDMVIGAHNYDAHFGRIGSLTPGDSVIFTDAENHRCTYSVLSIETLRPEQNSELVTKAAGDDWALTLFTCNYSGSARVVVRCGEA